MTAPGPLSSERRVIRVAPLLGAGNGGRNGLGGAGTDGSRLKPARRHRKGGRDLHPLKRVAKTDRLKPVCVLET